MNNRTNKPNPARSGFTLIELLAVITIISILLALILPAISGAMRNARDAQVSAEITRLETAISSFKAEYGIEPWSEIVLTEDPSVTAWRADSRTKLRRLFGSFTFSGQIDFNGDGAFTGDPATGNGELELTASECLVFFLGGMKVGTGVVGFSKNPLTPFNTTSENRTDQLMEFDIGRFVDVDGDGMFEYLDPSAGQATPYHFVSSNNGQGYNPTVGHYLDGSGKPWKRDSHQIISPGEDGRFGPATPLTPVYTPETELSGARLEEADNITNFSGGRLN
ncbi:MAG: prepilin-type N-terminal cleavage/methylation domain-containing protein [Planctomycetaceae bacterium]